MAFQRKTQETLSGPDRRHEETASGRRPRPDLQMVLRTLRMETEALRKAGVDEKIAALWREREARQAVPSVGARCALGGEVGAFGRTHGTPTAATGRRASKGQRNDLRCEPQWKFSKAKEPKTAVIAKTNQH